MRALQPNNLHTLLPTPPTLPLTTKLNHPLLIRRAPSIIFRTKHKRHRKLRPTLMLRRTHESFLRGGNELRDGFSGRVGGEVVVEDFDRVFAGYEAVLCDVC